MTRKKSDDAISPVVGVMLMLVVTIVLVAVIATFSTGLAAEAEPAPSVMLKAEVDSTWNDGYGTGTAFLSSLSGDPVNLEKVVVTLHKEDGKSYTYTHPSEAGGVGQYLESGETLNLAYGHFDTGGTHYLVDTGYTSWEELKDEYDNPILGENGYPISVPVYTVNSVGVFPITAGECIRVVVTYDDTHVLYDKEVAVV